MEIGTYIEKSVDHELSGNIIDLCPVGALNNKPYRFSARAWEMIAKPLVGAHDCAGSNLFAHVLRGKLRRIVPRDNEEINESWISDRDRFSCHALYSRGPSAAAAREAERPVGRRDVGRRARKRRRAPDRGRARGRRLDRRAREPERDARGAVSAEPHRAPLGQRQHRHAAAPARLPRPGRGSGGAFARGRHRGARFAGRRRRDRLESADGGADHRAPHPQGRAARARASRS